MKHLLVALTALLLFACNAASDKEVLVPYPSVIPQPQDMKIKQAYFSISSDTRILAGPGAVAAANHFAAWMNQQTDFNLAVERFTLSEDEPPVNSIYFVQRAFKNQTDEDYVMVVEPTYTMVQAAKAAGLFRGIATLQQLMPPEVHDPMGWRQDELYITCVDIADGPRFPWRGMLLDCSRHFMEKAFVKRYIDLLALHKMNTLHWHLTEDQGWRIEIDKYPLLTEVGAWRTDTAGNRYGGFYTKEDIREIVAYAAARHINVVPEIEMPGHSQAALAAYPHLSCTGGPFEVETEWGVFREIYCAGNDSTFIFMKDVLDEVMELFPSRFIHIGGDEAPKYRWERCDKCQKRIKDNDLHDEHELQSWFISQIGDYLQSKGRMMIGWDEILEGGLPEGAVVQSWRGFEGAKAAVESGNLAIVSPTSHAYFDYDLKAIDLEKVYSFEPVPAGVTAEQANLILGGECNMWSERAPQELVDSKVFPRILAMSEVLWTDTVARNWDHFYKRVQAHYSYLDALEVDFGFEAEPVTFASEVSADRKNIVVSLTPGMRGIDLHYTLDKTDPNLKSSIYSEPLKLDASFDINVQAFRRGKPMGDVFRRVVNTHHAMGLPAELENEFSPYYTGGGVSALTNGMRGTLDFRDGNWQGYSGNDFVAVVDLGKSHNVQKINSGYYQYNNAWIFLPEWVKYEISSDGENWTEVAKVDAPDPATKRGQFIKSYSTHRLQMDARYVRVTAKNIGQCPDWHEAAGSEAWLFVDEIVVR